jgi:hypothetical protein
MNSSLQNSMNAIQHPDVQSAMRVLSEYGLGVFLPHIHTEYGMESMPAQMVQLEQELKVSFVPVGTPGLEKAIPVGWVWDNEKAAVVCSCYCCRGPDDSCISKNIKSN